MATDQHHLLQHLAQELHRTMGLSPTSSVDLAAAILPIVEEAVRRRTAELAKGATDANQAALVRAAQRDSPARQRRSRRS